MCWQIYRLLKHLWLAALLLLAGCDLSPTQSGGGDTRVRLLISLPEETGATPLLKPRQTTGAWDARILHLDLSAWDSLDRFRTALDSTGRSTLWDTTGWNPKQDFWENASALLQSSGDPLYRFGGIYHLNVGDSSAAATLLVPPGLNYFLVCLREEENTIYWDEVFPQITVGEENTVELQTRRLVRVRIDSPADSAEFTRGQQIRFAGFATDLVHGDSIPGGNFRWISDHDGEIGRGVVLLSSALSVNRHRITLWAATRQGVKGRASIRISVLP